MGTPYALSSDLVSAWPAKSLAVAQYVDGYKLDTGPVQNAQTGTTYTFLLTDTTKTVTANNSAASAYTVPPQSSVVWEAYTVLRLVNLGAGVVTLTPGAGVTLTGSVAVPQYGSVSLMRTASNAWTISGTSDAPGSVLMTPSGVVNGTLSGGEVSFSAASTLSVNGCFNSTYDAYNVVIQLAQSVDTTIALRMRASGTDASGANYDTQVVLNASTSVTAARVLTATSANFGYASTDHFSTIDFHSPALAATTYFMSKGYYGPGASSFLFFGRHAVSTAYDGFTIIPGSGTITGKLRVYGLKKS
jgi:hypothetical protein